MAQTTELSARPRGARTPSVQTIALTIFPLVVVLGEVIIKKAAGVSILPGLGPTLAAVALGQVMPFVVFESLLAAKVLTFTGTYAFEGAELSVRYLLSPQRDTQSIEQLRSLSLLLFIGCLLVWMASVTFATRLAPGQEYSLISTGLGVFNCLLAWLFLVRV